MERPFRATHTHYKGGLYELLHSGRMEADLSEVIIYRNGEGQIWVRPSADFFGTVVMPDMSEVPRFRPLPPVPPFTVSSYRRDECIHDYCPHANICSWSAACSEPMVGGDA